MRAISDQQFKECLEKKGLFLVDIWAEWCTSCKRLTPVLENLSKEYSVEKIEFLKLDADSNSDTCIKLGIRGIPAVVIIKDGNIKELLMGVKSSDEYKAIIDSLMN